MPPSDLVSRAVRNFFEDYLVANSSVGQIDAEFDAAGLVYSEPSPSPSGARRTRVRGYYQSIDWKKPEDIAKFFEVLTFFMAKEERVAGMYGSNWYQSPEILDRPLKRVVEQLQRSGYEWQDGTFVAVSATARLADAKALAVQIDLPHLGEHIRRIEAAIDTDPALAVGSAKEMVETVCKTIIVKRAAASGITYSRDDDINDLGKKAFAVLRQLPDDIPEKAKGSKAIKTMLSNLRTIVGGIAELRNLYGSGHGKEGGTRRGLLPRHARLVVGAASTLAYYLLETDRDTALDFKSDGP